MSTLDSTVLDTIHPDLAAALKAPVLNDFMSMGRSVWSAVRAYLQNDLLNAETVPIVHQAQIMETMTRQSEAKMHLPAKIGDYTGNTYKNKI
jgi:fumarylacetoacetase